MESTIRRPKKKYFATIKELFISIEPEYDKWLFTLHNIPMKYICILKAIITLFKNDNGYFNDLNIDVWKKWIPLLVNFHQMPNENCREIVDNLLILAYSKTTQSFIECVLNLINYENENKDGWSVFEIIDLCWDDNFSKALLHKLNDRNLTAKYAGRIFRCLLEHNVNNAINEAQKIIESFVNPKITNKSILFACNLIIYDEAAGWKIIWPLILKDNEFGRKIFIELVEISYNNLLYVGRKLSEEQLSELYIWLFNNFKLKPKYVETLIMSPSDKIQHFCDSILRHLVERGTYKACDEIKKINKTLPEFDFGARVLEDALLFARKKTWETIEPKYILMLAKDSTRRFVQNGVQLLEVIIESLKRLEDELHGETASVIFLWNEFRNENGKKWEPKDEADLSDYVKLYLVKDLKNRGIILNREVEISRGEKTDIYVDAVSKINNDEFKVVNAVIEVKGCWNRDLDNAIETQLVKTYLEDKKCCYGIYLIGWFLCSDWNNDDYRKKDCLKYNINDLKSQFQTKAQNLSSDKLLVKSFVINADLRIPKKNNPAPPPTLKQKVRRPRSFK